MSNKTLKQRIAVVAASALTAGFLSVVAMPAANASSTAVSVTTVTGQITAAATSGSATTLTITATGNATFAVAAVASTVFGLNISGGTFERAASGGTINGDRTQFTGTGANTAIAGLVAVPTGAGRNMVITSYFGTAAVAANGTNELTALAASRTAGTVDRTITATVIAAGTNGVFNSGLSAIAIVNSASTASSTTNADTSNANIIAAGGTGVISYDLKDANNNSLSSSSIVYASIKSGACVIGLSTAPTAGTMVVGVSPADLIYVAQADAVNTPPATCLVDITVDGVLAATKSFTFQGPVASIEVTGLGVAQSSGTRTGLGYVVAKDAAGTLIGNVAVSGITLDSSKSGIVSAVSVSANTARISSGLNTGTGVSSTTIPSTVGWTCGSTVGTAPVAFRTPNGIGGYITSPTYNVACAGNPVTYTASLDKASYLPGDIATLTVTGKGSKGELANDAFVIGSGSAGEVISLTGSQLTLVGAVGTDTLTSGSKTYKFVVGTTEGSYNLVVDVPLILTATNKATYGAATQTVAYKVAGSGAVSNADVLKSIVALIASINKQIQALQKLILKR
jgi:trimeric autotransporter adhesin